MTKNILLAAAVAVALTGCESLYRSAGLSTPPDPKNPRVWVMTEEGGCAAPQIVVAPEPIYIHRPGNAQVVAINWRLETDGYHFATLGDPAPQGNSAKDEIYGCRVDGPKNAHCNDRAQTKGSWKYTLSIASDDPKKCPSPQPLDPIIVNG